LPLGFRMYPPPKDAGWCVFPHALERIERALPLHEFSVSNVECNRPNLRASARARTCVCVCPMQSDTRTRLRRRVTFASSSCADVMLMCC